MLASEISHFLIKEVGNILNTVVTFLNITIKITTVVTLVGKYATDSSHAEVIVIKKMNFLKFNCNAETFEDKQ